MTQAFNLSQFANFVNSSGKADLTTAVTGTLPVANGGSGAAAFSSGSVLLGSGTSSFGTVAPGAAGNILTSNGSTWTSATPAVGTNIVYITTTQSWTVPAGISSIIVACTGGAGGGFKATNYPAAVLAAGGNGGMVCARITGMTGTIAVTIGAGAAASSTSSGSEAAASGSTSSFGSYITCTGGGGAHLGVTPLGGYGSVAGTNGTATLSGATKVQINLFTGYGATSTGIGNTSWNIEYSIAPGTGLSPTYADTGLTAGNGMGGAVAIIY